MRYLDFYFKFENKKNQMKVRAFRPNIIPRNRYANFLPIKAVSGSSFTLMNLLIILIKIASIHKKILLLTKKNYRIDAFGYVISSKFSIRFLNLKFESAPWRWESGSREPCAPREASYRDRHSRFLVLAIRS